MRRRSSSPLPSALPPPAARRLFVVRIENRDAVDSGGEMTAHITPVDDMAHLLDEHDVRLGDAVGGIISDLLVQMVREEEGGGAAT